MTAKEITKKYIFIIIPAIIVILALVAILIPILMPKAPMVRPLQKVTLFEVKKVPIKNSWEVIAQLEADRKIEIVARVSGFLEAKYYQEGDQVTENQVLFLIEPAPYEAAKQAAYGNFLSAEAQLNQAQLNFTRVEDLYKKKSSPKSDFDAAKAALDVAEAGVVSSRALYQQAEINYLYTQIKAPFAGKITDATFSVGAFVGPTSGPLAHLVADDPIQATFGVPDIFLKELRFGGGDAGGLPRGGIPTVVVKLRINEEYIYPEPGTISYVSPTVDQGTDTTKIKASFPNPDGNIVPGEVVTLILEDREPREALLVPKNSILISSHLGSFVYVLGKSEPGPDGTTQTIAVPRPITRGLEYPEGIEVTQGLTAGDKIVELGLMAQGATLRPNTPVEVVENYESIFTQGSGTPNPAESRPAESSPDPTTDTGGEG
ncbi:MAG: efflux RND transporter periplasmic adaptor subunit [Deltaproteobacteria bacterium]|nr:efflux RND transporter periplasmic adaptor subunit [Deltaproteobacteria bacterium]